MTTPAQGKGKKKNKESTKVSLEEFRSFDAPHGHNVVSIKTTGTGLDWAEAMADQPVTETQQIIVPTAPRAQRGPGFDIDSLPETGPFRVSIFGLPMSVEEDELEKRIFQGLDVVRIESTKSSTTVELANRDHLYEALCKDGSSVKGRTINVLLFGQVPQNNYGSDRYGGRGGNSSFGDRYGADRDRGFAGQRGGGRFGDRPGGFNRDRDSSYGGFNRGGYGQPRGGGGGFGDRFNDRFNDRPNDRFSDHRPPMDRFSDRPNDRFNDRPIERSFNDRPIERTFVERPSERFPDRFAERSEQRQKLDLKKRTTPLNLDDVSRNEAIFGQAKPSSKPYEKLMEIEEKLKGKE